MATVLLVEDDHVVRGAMLRSLADRGHAVHAVGTALDALRRVAAETPDLVVLDLGLPDLDGSDALRMLRGITDVPIIIATARDPDLFKRLLSEVSWLATTSPTTSKPKADKLGPKFTVTVLIKDKATQTYDLYPNAAGGPRAYRPAKQPGAKKTPGWFYGRLTMSESLRLSGVPLKEKPDVVSGGIGGGIGEEVPTDELDPLEVGNDVLADLRQLFLLNGAVLLVIMLGLGGIAYLIRRRV